MQLCISTLVCPNWTLPQIVGAADAHGVAGIDFRGLGSEIDITRHPRFDAELDSTLDLLRQHKLELPCMNTSVALVTPAAERWEMMLAECHRYATLARRTGTRLLRVFGGMVPKGLTRAEAVTMAQRHLRQLVKIAQPCGCVVLLETHDDWSGSADALGLVKEFSPEEAGILWDLEHPFRRGEKPSDTAATLRPFLRHIHIKDSVRIEGKSQPRLLGEGELPLADLLAAMRGIGYDGWICLETEKRWHPQAAPEPEQSVPQFVQFMAKHWPPAQVQAASGRYLRYGNPWHPGIGIPLRGSLGWPAHRAAGAHGAGHAVRQRIGARPAHLGVQHFPGRGRVPDAPLPRAQRPAPDPHGGRAAAAGQPRAHRLVPQER